MRRLMNDNRIREISSSVDIRGLNLLDSRTTVGSLSENDEYSYDEMERFWSNSRNIRESIATGSEPFPGEMLNPTSENVPLSKKMLALTEWSIITLQHMKILISKHHSTMVRKIRS